jgi:FAD/FMN-containing dehydrogenase
VAGLTLGGGLGYLTRRFGWTVDNLVEAEVVTADGRVRRASRDQHPDLFWALRGGGGNFGVATRFGFRLHQVGPEVHGGLVAWPFERAAEVMDAYRSITAEAPRELAVWLLLLRAPAAPFVPASWHRARGPPPPLAHRVPGRAGGRAAGRAAGAVRRLPVPEADLGLRHLAAPSTSGPATTGPSGGANDDRLVEAKRRWDPGNLFRANRNIAP